MRATDGALYRRRAPRGKFSPGVKTPLCGFQMHLALKVTKATRPNILPYLSSAAVRTGIEPSVVFTPICA
jgi:hypothetical protein